MVRLWSLNKVTIITYSKVGLITYLQKNFHDAQHLLWKIYFLEKASLLSENRTDLNPL